MRTHVADVQSLSHTPYPLDSEGTLPESSRVRRGRDLEVWCSAEWLAVDALEHRGQSLPSTDAHGLEPVPAAPAVELAQQRGENAGARGADRVTQRDPGAVDVESFQVAVEVPLTQHRQNLDREGFV